MHCVSILGPWLAGFEISKEDSLGGCGLLGGLTMLHNKCNKANGIP